MQSTFEIFCRTPQVGAVKLPGLFVVARHSGVRSFLASERARRTSRRCKKYYSVHLTMLGPVFVTVSC
jgi:hypothetical protein